MDALQLSKVTVKYVIVLQKVSISHKCSSFALNIFFYKSIHFHKNIEQQKLFWTLKKIQIEYLPQ